VDCSIWSANVCGIPDKNTENDQRGQPGIRLAGEPVKAGDGPEQVSAPGSDAPTAGTPDPRGKEPALRRLHDASDEVLAVFEQTLRDDASAAGASEQEIRDAQEEHPERP
jgi:hypothetical protein